MNGRRSVPFEYSAEQNAEIPCLWILAQSTNIHITLDSGLSMANFVSPRFSRSLFLHTAPGTKFTVSPAMSAVLRRHFNGLRRHNKIYREFSAAFRDSDPDYMIGFDPQY